MVVYWYNWLCQELCSDYDVLCSSYASYCLHTVSLQVEVVNTSMKDLQSQHARHQQEVGKLKGNMAAVATALEAVRSNRRNLLEQATLEQVGFCCARGFGSNITRGSFRLSLVVCSFMHSVV